MEDAPQYLYKILSEELWEKSQDCEALLLSSDDDAFIHLSKEDQLDRIMKKYWFDISRYVVLKIHSGSLTGLLVYETNPGGETKHYHLYNGSIPLNAVVEIQIFDSSSS